MKFEHTEVFNFEGALRGMRNPMNSWDKSDSGRCSEIDCNKCSQDKLGGTECSKIGRWDFAIGRNDMELAQKLIKAGEPHRKFLRQIFVSVDITAPLYWWKEFDTYKVGTVANSTSTMHKLASTPITKDCFEMDDYEDVDVPLDCGANVYNFHHFWKNLIIQLEWMRQKYNETKDKRYWKELIRLLPESWLQTRTITMNYENILNMVKYRENHKLTEWSISFMEWVKSLPYANEFIFINNK